MPAARRKAITWIAIIVGAVSIAGFVLGPRMVRSWQAPLGPALQLPTQTPRLETPTSAPPTSTPEVVAAAPQATEPLPTATSEPTATPRPLCGGPPTMTVLGVGADSRNDSYLYGLSDVIRVVRVDFVTPKVTVLSMPRDLWVEIPGIADHYGITHGKLNQSYLYGGPGLGYYDGPGDGPGLLARTLDLNFGLRVDHYGSVNMVTFVRIVDALGGIDLYLPEDVDGRPIDEKTEDMGYFYAGQQHFNGDQALRFSRIRKKYNDFTRMDNQNMVLCALQDKLLSPSVLPRVPQLIAAFQDSVLTDLSPAQLGQLACLAPRLDRENLLFASIPQDMLEPAREYSDQLKDTTFVYRADFNELRSLMADFQAGTWPDKPKEPTCP